MRHPSRNPALPLAALALLCAVAPAARAASTRWAVSVVGYSSQFSATAWSVAKILCPPDVWPLYGDQVGAWAPLSADGQREFVELDFGNSQPINYVAAFETFHPGAIDSVYAWNAMAAQYELLWSAPAFASGDSARIWAATFPLTSFPVSRLRITLDSPHVPGWNEIDAVAIGQDSIAMAFTVWADSASASSSYHAVGGYSANAATGVPNVYPAYGDISNAWASRTADGSREWLQLRYPRAVNAREVDVFETFNPGAVDSIYVRYASDGSLHLVYSALPATLPPTSVVLAQSLAGLPEPIDGVRLTVASDQVGGWNEIDAAGLAIDTSFVPVPTSYVSAPPGAPGPPGLVCTARPNPFRAATRFVFAMPDEGDVRLEVFDARGARIRTLESGWLPAGPRQAVWDGCDARGRRVPPGLYLARLVTGRGTTTARVVRVE